MPHFAGGCRLPEHVEGFQPLPARIPIAFDRQHYNWWVAKVSAPPYSQVKTTFGNRFMLPIGSYNQVCAWCCALLSTPRPWADRR